MTDQGAGRRVGQARHPRQRHPALPGPHRGFQTWLDIADLRSGADGPLPRRHPDEPAGAAEDIVGPAVFLASDAAAMVTGCCCGVDGGNLALNAGGSHTW